MPDRIGDGPVQPELVERLNAVAKLIDMAFNGDVPRGDRKIGFALLVFPFHGHEGRCNYISNADRQDIVVMLKEQVARFEGQPEMKGTA